jgi:hypothetical protein
MTNKCTQPQGLYKFTEEDPRVYTSLQRKTPGSMQVYRGKPQGLYKFTDENPRVYTSLHTDENLRVYMGSSSVCKLV